MHGDVAPVEAHGAIARCEQHGVFARVVLADDTGGYDALVAAEDFPFGGLGAVAVEQAFGGDFFDRDGFGCSFCGDGGGQRVGVLVCARGLFFGEEAGEVGDGAVLFLAAGGCAGSGGGAAAAADGGGVADAAVAAEGAGFFWLARVFGGAGQRC